jgi:dTDP-4-amino-4,6-dideoxygalactose transaminase
MDDMHAAIGRAQIKKMFPIAEGRRKVVSAFMEGIKDVKAVSASPVTEKAAASYWFLRLIFNADAVTCDKATFAKALAAEGIGANTYYAATPFTSDWYQNSIVFGDSGYPWAAPEYTGDREKRYTLDDVPNARKALEDTIILNLNESWTEDNIREVAAAFRKVYNAYRIKLFYPGCGFKITTFKIYVAADKAYLCKPVFGGDYIKRGGNDCCT